MSVLAALGTIPSFAGDAESEHSDAPLPLRLFMTFADFDTLGNNPLLSGFWRRSARRQLAWREIELPLLTGLARLNGSLTIFQTGPGNDAHTLKMEGTGSFGRSGFYSKEALTASAWEFVSEI